MKILSLLFIFFPCFLLHRCAVYTKGTYDEAIAVRLGKYAYKLGTREHTWNRELDVFEFHNVHVLARKSVVEEYVANHGVKNEHACPKLAYFEQVFDAILSSHEAVGHAKSERTHKMVIKKFSNISRNMVELFISMCPRCATTKIVPAKQLPRKPIISETFNDRGQVDLIDMQSIPDGPFRWILHYQDHLTKFCYLRALRKKST